MFWLLVILAIIILVAVSIYNNLQRAGQHVKAAHSNILTMVQKRSDLINKAMDIAKSYGEHEKFIHVMVSNNLRDMITESQQAMSNLMAIAQAFPALTANTAYNSLMASLNETEAGLQEKREYYNMAVEAYNSARIVFPNNLIAEQLGFQEAPYFDFDNLQAMHEFRTDDGRLLREALGKAGDQAVDITKKGYDKVRTEIDNARETQPPEDKKQ